SLHIILALRIATFESHIGDRSHIKNERGVREASREPTQQRMRLKQDPPLREDKLLKLHPIDLSQTTPLNIAIRISGDDLIQSIQRTIPAERSSFIPRWSNIMKQRRNLIHQIEQGCSRRINMLI